MELKAEILLLLCLLRRIVNVRGSNMECRDSSGTFERHVFNRWTCSSCYVYLFPNNIYRFNYNKSNPALTKDLQIFYSPDIKDPESLHVLCDNLGDRDCDRWKTCCDAAEKCCELQIESSSTSGTDDRRCPKTWDGWSCFDDAIPGTKTVKQCPDFLKYGSLTGNAEKVCTINGTWAVYSEKGNREWTDYSKCVNIKGVTGVVYAGAIASTISLILLVPATIIFFVFRQLRTQHRIKLHICLFLSFMMTTILQLIWMIRVHKDRLSHPREETFMVQKETWCKTIYIMSRYARCTNFFWMFCEGLFLHRLLVQAFQCPRSVGLYYIIGWGCPLVPIIVYMSIRIFQADDTCWIKNAAGLEWIVYTPNLLCILFNALFLLGILRILITQLHQHPNEPSNYRRALKATFVLIPLFGLQWFLIIYRPSSRRMMNIYEIASEIIIDSQGGVIALVFCYLNGEVITCLKGVLCKFRYGESTKGHSFATSYSVVTNKGQDGNETIPMKEKVH